MTSIKTVCNQVTCPQPCVMSFSLKTRLQTKGLFDPCEVCAYCEGCLVVRSGHGPQAEVAQGFGPQPLVEL